MHALVEMSGRQSGQEFKMEGNRRKPVLFLPDHAVLKELRTARMTGISAGMPAGCYTIRLESDQNSEENTVAVGITGGYRPSRITCTRIQKRTLLLLASQSRTCKLQLAYTVIP
jgi:hypothetical protein